MKMHQNRQKKMIKLNCEVDILIDKENLIDIQ